MRKLFNVFQWGIVFGFAVMVAACAHPINISPVATPKREEAKLINKRVAYVMTDELRNKSVTTSGGGGDQISYNPYRDLEKSIRDALRAVYSDVKVINQAEGNTQDIDLIFTPIISTSSSSDSMLTWPPTQFFVNLECAVTNAQGVELSTLRVSGNGKAEFSEFKSDFGLAGRRAASSLADKLVEEIQGNSVLQ